MVTVLVVVWNNARSEVRLLLFVDGRAECMAGSKLADQNPGDETSL
jgi:hypothetical protein